MTPLPGNLSDLSTATQSRKVRLKQLAQQLEAMEAAAARHCPIPVIRLDGGRRRPRNLPDDCLIIRLHTDAPPTDSPQSDGGHGSAVDGQPTPTS